MIGYSYTIASSGVMINATYVFNALGQRVEKALKRYTPCSSGNVARASQTNATVAPQACNTWVGTSVVRYAYDDSGHLLGEYDSVTGYSQETVWLNGVPVATVQGGAVYNIHTDNLGTPRSILRASDNAEVWRWDSDPFGNTNPTAPTAGVSLTYNLRFPGQYYDSESGMHYNVMRDYVPSTGRYLEADPTGLQAGLARYTYVGANPLVGIDPNGLNDITKHFRGVPDDAIYYRAPNGVSFAAPPTADFSEIYLAGQLNGVFEANAYIGHWGEFDFQRNSNTFINAYTDASNYAVGVYMNGAGSSLGTMDFIGSLFALTMSSNPGPNQSNWWNSGWIAANSGSLPKACLINH